MQSARTHIAIGITLLAGAVALAGCKTEPEPSGGKLRVVCTTTMIADLAREIAGDRAEIIGIMKPGEDPHIYDQRPRDAQHIASADVVLYNGLHLEATLADTIHNNHRGDAVVAALAEHSAISPLESETYQGAPDPHCWMNVAYFVRYAEGARDAQTTADPDNAEHYRANAAAYIEKLQALDTWVREQIATIPRARRVMVTSHDAFQYYSRAYYIDVLAVIGISTDQQASPQDIERLKRQVREHNVRAVFIETSVSQTLNRMVEKVADETGVRVGGTLFSDSLGEPGTPGGSYIGMIRHNTTTVVEALK